MKIGKRMKAWESTGDKIGTKNNVEKDQHRIKTRTMENAAHAII